MFEIIQDILLYAEIKGLEPNHLYYQFMVQQEKDQKEYDEYVELYLNLGLVYNLEQKENDIRTTPQ